MNYSENIKKSHEADLVYAKWYAQQSNERKAAMILSGYRMVEGNVRRQVREENPFAPESAVTMKFIEHTQKSEYSIETYAFIVEQMEKRMEKEWQQRFKTMQKELGWSYEDIAKFMGAANGDSVKASVNRKLPKFAKLAVCVYEEMKK